MSPREAILALLAEREADATICPTEAARRIGGEHWRGAMPAVHEAALALQRERQVQLWQRGNIVAKPAGAYRIGHRDLP